MNGPGCTAVSNGTSTGGLNQKELLKIGHLMEFPGEPEDQALSYVTKYLTPSLPSVEAPQHLHHSQQWALGYDVNFTLAEASGAIAQKTLASFFLFQEHGMARIRVVPSGCASEWEDTWSSRT